MIKATVLMSQGHTEVIPFETIDGALFFKDVVETQRYPNVAYYSFERSVKVRDITRVIFVEEEN